MNYDFYRGALALKDELVSVFGVVKLLQQKVRVCRCLVTFYGGLALDLSRSLITMNAIYVVTAVIR